VLVAEAGDVLAAEAGDVLAAEAGDVLVAEAEEPLLPAGLLTAPRPRRSESPVATHPAAGRAPWEAGGGAEGEAGDWDWLGPEAGGHPLGAGVRLAAGGVGVEAGVSGLPLLIAGRNVARGGLAGRPAGRAVRPNEVLWPPATTAAAFAAVGTTREGQICLAAARVAVTVAELADLLRVGATERERESV
jgi:hypothetical protein